MPKRQHEPSEKDSPYPKSNSFFRNFLTAVHCLQRVEGLEGGVSTEDIVCYMLRNYSVDGDIHSQITWAANQGVCCGFLQERECRYFLIHAMAKIYLASGDGEKQQQVCYAKHLFKSSWKCCVNRPRTPICCPQPICPAPKCPPLPVTYTRNCPPPCPKKRCKTSSDCDCQSKSSKRGNRRSSRSSRQKRHGSKSSSRNCAYERSGGKSGVCGCTKRNRKR